MESAIIAPTVAPVGRIRLSTVRQATLSAYWFSSSAHWAAILVILMPKQIVEIVGDASKGTALSNVLLAGAFVSMVVAPFFGAISDRLRLPWGRRRPFLVVGTLANVIGLIGLAYVARPGDPSSLWPYVFFFIWIALFNNMATAPYSALIPDVVLPEQRGSASGWLGLMTMLGNFVGGIMGFLLPSIGVTGAYWLLAAIMLLGMGVTVLTVREPSPPEVPAFRWRMFLAGLVSPFRSRDFTWVFLTRFLVVMGTFTVQPFLQFYLSDVVGAPFRFFGITISDDPAVAVSLFILALLLGAIVSAYVAGALSDRYGRKAMVYLSGALQAVVIGVFIVYSNYTVAVLLGIVFGLGYGAYQSVDWALATDVLPSRDDYAKDMGVWHVAFTLPQVIATPIAGRLLDTFQGIGRAAGATSLGYTVIFGIAIVYFILGTVFVRQVRGAR